jgi:hypothetical protein
MNQEEEEKKEKVETVVASSPEVVASEDSPVEVPKEGSSQEVSSDKPPFATEDGSRPTQTQNPTLPVQPDVDTKVSETHPSSESLADKSGHQPNSTPSAVEDHKAPAGLADDSYDTKMPPPPVQKQNPPISATTTNIPVAATDPKASLLTLDESTPVQSKPTSTTPGQLVDVKESSVASPEQMEAMEIDRQSPDIRIANKDTTTMDLSPSQQQEAMDIDSEQPAKTADEGPAAQSPKLIIKRKRKPLAQDTTLGEVFEIVNRKSKRSRKKKKKNAIKIELTTAVVPSQETAQPVQARLTDGTISAVTTTTADRLLNFNEESWFGEFGNDSDEALTFYEETHEEQDPEYLEYIKQKKKADLRKELEELDRRDKEGKKEIEDLISRLSKEKRDSTDKSHHVYREKVNEDERKEQTVLHKMFTERQNADSLKIQKGQKMLQARQQKDVDIAVHNHNQQQGLSDEQRQMIWQKTTMSLQAKHDQQRQEFLKRTDELKKKTAQEYSIESQKIAKKYAKKKAEVDARRDKFVAQQLDQFTQLKQRYLKRHLQRFVAEKEALSKRISESKGSDQTAYGRKDSSPARQSRRTHEKEEHQPLPPIRSVPDWVRDPEIENADSVVRQKLRKGVLSQAVRHVSIEVHNEGIWTLSIRKTDDDGAAETVEKEFIQWGPRAFQTLEAIVSGEVPSFYNKLDLSHGPVSQGGQIRCSITDLRTSPEVALVDRVEAYKEQEKLQLYILEKQSKELSKQALDLEKALRKTKAEESQASSASDSAAETVERSKAELHKFTTKFRSFLGPGKSEVDVDARMNVIAYRNSNKWVFDFLQMVNHCHR